MYLQWPTCSDANIGSGIENYTPMYFVQVQEEMLQQCFSFLSVTDTAWHWQGIIL